MTTLEIVLLVIVAIITPFAAFSHLRAKYFMRVNIKLYRQVWILEQMIVEKPISYGSTMPQQPVIEKQLNTDQK